MEKDIGNTASGKEDVCLNKSAAFDWTSANILRARAGEGGGTGTGSVSLQRCGSEPPRPVVSCSVQSRPTETPSAVGMRCSQVMLSWAKPINFTSSGISVLSQPDASLKVNTL